VGPVTVIPVNRLDRAKGRLADLLSVEERASLQLHTLKTVVAAVRGAGLEPRVLTADETIARELPGVEVVPEQAALSGLNAQLETAIRGLQEVLILHADLPLASGAEVRSLVESAPHGLSVTMVRSPDGGTNAMLLRPPGRFALAYGPDSHAKHSSAAEAAGMSVTTVDSPALSLDLDTRADVAALLASEPGRLSPAGRYLLSIGADERLA
jgi:2-phospho-L-lactate guanylyltransferase